MELLAFGEPLGAGLERMVAASVLASVESKGLLSVERPVDASRFGSATRCMPRWFGRKSRHFGFGPPPAPGGRRRGDGARRTGDLLRIVTWRLGVGVSSPAEQLTMAARQAMALFDYELAERLARAAVDAGGGLAAEYLVGEALLAVGRVEEANWS